VKEGRKEGRATGSVVSRAVGFTSRPGPCVLEQDTEPAAVLRCVHVTCKVSVSFLKNAF